MKDREISISASKSAERRIKGFEGGKICQIGIPDNGVEILRYMEYRQKVLDMEGQRMGEFKEPSQFVIFWSREKKPCLHTLKPTQYDNLIISIREKSGLYFDSYGLRRSYAKHLYNNGEDLAVIQSIFRSFRPKDFSQIYRCSRGQRGSSDEEM